jgi:hypothetical protein
LEEEGAAAKDARGIRRKIQMGKRKRVEPPRSTREDQRRKELAADKR